jgi:hypothetical protein
MMFGILLQFKTWKEEEAWAHSSSPPTQSYWGMDPYSSPNAHEASRCFWTGWDGGPLSGKCLPSPFLDDATMRGPGWPGGNLSSQVFLTS